MKRMMQFFFGLGVGNAVLAPIGFMTPGADLAGAGATVLCVGAFAVLAVVNNIDNNARDNFLQILGKFRVHCPTDAEMQKKFDKLESDIIQRKPLVHIAHEIGYLNGQMVSRGYMKEGLITRPDATV